MHQEALRLGQRDRPGAAQLILELSTALSFHDRRTRGHAERVRAYVDLTAKEMKIGAAARAKLGWAALLHDIGKLRVAPEILRKPGALDQVEWSEMRRHPRLGEQLCSPLLEWLGEWARGIADHHENFDGSGYPDGRAGQSISLAGRLVRVADAYDVMTSVRSYKKPLSPETARRELVAKAGSDFDPAVVRAFLRIGLGRIRWAAGPLSWLAQTPILRVLQAGSELGTAAAAAASTAAVSAAVVGLNLLAPAGASAAVPLPAIADHTVTIERDTTLTESIISAAEAAGGYQIVIQVPPEHGSARAGNGAIVYTPAPGYLGGDAVGFGLVGPGQAAAGAAHMYVRVVDSTGAPLPGNDSATTTEGTPVLIDVLANDPEGCALRAIVTAPVHGAAAIAAGGATEYRPQDGFTGTDTFGYEVADAAGRVGRAVVTVEVTPEGGPPEARADYFAAEAGGSVVVPVLANDSDPDGDLDPGPCGSPKTLVSARPRWWAGAFDTALARPRRARTSSPTRCAITTAGALTRWRRGR